MTMHSVYFKEHEGVIQNSMGPLSPVSMPWWSGLGSQSAYGTFGQLKSLPAEHPIGGDQFTFTKASEINADQGVEKGNTTHFTIYPGNCKSFSDRRESPQLQAAVYMHPALPENRGPSELKFGQPMISAKYPYGDQCYGVLTYAPQIMGRIMLPLNLTTDDGPIYVNAKQYHGILRRRHSREKEEMRNKAIKKRKEPYLHLSRHLHAMRRPRGSGGRFLNTKSLNGGKDGAVKKKAGDELFWRPTNSQNSEVLQSNSGNLNSTKEASDGGSNLSGSEVTSMYSRETFDPFRFNDITPAVKSLSNVMCVGHGHIIPSKWI